MRLRRLGLAVLAAIGAATALASPASAHAELIGSSPAADAVLDRSPDAIVLEFTEPVDTVADSIRLFDASGDPVEIGGADQRGGGATLTASVDAPLTGTYVVSWSAVSADSHPISGAFTFSVGEPTATAPGLVADVLAGSGDGSGDAAATWLGVGRWLSYAGAAVLLGGFAVIVLCAPHALATRRAGLLLASAAAVGVAGTLLMIAAQSSVIGSSMLDPGGWADVSESRAGRWWVARLVLLAIGGPLLLGGYRLLDRRPFLGLTAGFALLVAAVVAAGGHAITGRATALGLIATIVHLVAMGVWFGGMIALAAVVARRDLWPTAVRFSPLALGSVVALAVTGAVNGWRQIGRFGALTDTAYGRWLVVKLLIVVVVVAAAAFSRSRVQSPAPALPATGRRATVSAAAADEIPADDTGLRRSVLIEVVGLVAVLAATAGLVNSPPPRAIAAADAGPVSVSVAEGPYVAQLDLVPAVTGGTTMHIYLTPTESGQPPADEITVEASLPAQQLGPLDIPTVAVAPNHVTTDDADIPVPGDWEFAITARFGDFDQLVFRATVAVE